MLPTKSTPLSSTFFTLLSICLIILFLSSPTSTTAPPSSFSGRFETCKVSPELKTTPLCDPTAPLSTRVSSLISALTTDEKILLLDRLAWESGVPRLHLSPFAWRQNLIHGLGSGVNYTGLPHGVTMFPQIINVGRSFDAELMEDFGQALGDEMRAVANMLNSDLSVWSPNINVFRDPRWGRGQETPGEDPYLTGTYGVIYTKSMQAGNSNSNAGYLKTIVTLKHYTAYDLEDYDGVKRYQFDAKVAAVDLAETYQRPFKMAVQQAEAAGVMCSYNAVNGIPMCAHDELIGSVLRDEWGFKGLVVSDSGAIRWIQWGHFYRLTAPEACAAAIIAGCDLNSGDYYGANLQISLNEKLITEDVIDVAAGRLIRVRVMTGEFDAWENQPYRKIPLSVVSSPAHQELALQMARESLVLLKNDNAILPLDASSFSHIAIIGPNANATEELLGNYNGPAPFIISPAEGLSSIPGVKTVTYVKGCGIDSRKSEREFEEAVKAAEAADAVVLVMGLDQTQEREGHDREKLSWPGVQLKLIQEVASKVGGSSKKPVILVVLGAGPIDVSWSKESDLVQGIVFAGYPGQSGGRALAELLFGVFSPSGRLTTTVYPASYAEKTSMFDMSLRPDAEGSPFGRTYKFYEGTPVYSFGDGLSYTTFAFKWFDTSMMRISRKSLLEEQAIMQKEKKGPLMTPNSTHFSVNVTNTGKVVSDVSVLAFIENNVAEREILLGLEPPKKELFGFRYVRGLKPGQTETIQFGVGFEALRSVDVRGKERVLSGKYRIVIGSMDEVISREIWVV